MKSKLTILLASKSPRRRGLIENLGFDYRIVEADVEEVIPQGMQAKDVAEYLARLKSSIDISLADNEILLTADTIVIQNEQVIGKPKDMVDAKEILTRLSGQTHTVITGFSLRSNQKQVSDSVVTEIEFHTVSEEEIDYYLKNYEVMDKAGAYAIQEWIGQIGIKGITGDYYNVMGLPVSTIYQVLKSF